jgi:hypothetical protein
MLCLASCSLVCSSTCSCCAVSHIQSPSHTVLFVCSNVRSELTQLKSSEASIQATAEEVQQQLQQKDNEIEALKAKLALLDRY